MKTYRYLIIIALIGGLFLFSCQKEDAIAPDSKNDQVEVMNDNDYLAQNLAILVANSIGNNKESSSFIKTELMKQFDGDYNFLFSEARNKSIDGSDLKSGVHTTFGNVLKQNTSNLKGNWASTKFDELFDRIEKERPLLQIALPEIFENSSINWDSENEELLVAFIPDDYDEKTTEYVTAYDKNGNSFQIDAQNPPERPIMVIGDNERLIAIPITEMKAGLKVISECVEPYYSNDSYDYYVKASFYEECPPDDGGGEPYPDPAPGPTVYDRDNNNSQDFLSKAIFVSESALDAMEGWLSGAPDMMLNVVYVQKINGQMTAGSVFKDIGSDGWYHRTGFLGLGGKELDMKIIDIDIVNWRKETFGEVMKYVWHEDDPGDDHDKVVTITYKDPITGITYTETTTIKRGDNDELAGEALVTYYDKTNGVGTRYNTGILKFWVNQK